LSRPSHDVSAGFSSTAGFSGADLIALELVQIRLLLRADF
jgi:hypothetical protein